MTIMSYSSYSAFQATSRHTAETSSQVGPVLLAIRSFTGLHAPLAVARWLAAREERELRVVSVLEHDDTATAIDDVLSLAERDDVEEQDTRAAQITRALTPCDGHAEPPLVEIVHGPSANGVVDVAQRCNARVIVIGTGKHHPTGRYIYGQRALEIVGIADRPVLVVPREATAASVSVALVAVDFSPASVQAARAVLPMLSQGGHLVLVHVPTADAGREEPTGRGNEAIRQRCAELFAHFQRQLPSSPGVSVETKFFHGDPVQTLLEYATMRNAGLIACGRLGHSLAARIFVGSVSSALVRRATCPVLVAPELSGDMMAPQPSQAWLST
jgi:nucleotide-binding universal stress UspA family protein